MGQSDGLLLVEVLVLSIFLIKGCFATVLCPVICFLCFYFILIFISFLFPSFGFVSVSVFPCFWVRVRRKQLHKPEAVVKAYREFVETFGRNFVPPPPRADAKRGLLSREDLAEQQRTQNLFEVRNAEMYHRSCAPAAQIRSLGVLRYLVIDVIDVLRY